MRTFRSYWSSKRTIPRQIQFRTKLYSISPCCLEIRARTCYFSGLQFPEILSEPPKKKSYICNYKVSQRLCNIKMVLFTIMKILYITHSFVLHRPNFPPVYRLYSNSGSECQYLVSRFASCLHFVLHFLGSCAVTDTIIKANASLIYHHKHTSFRLPSVCA